jgi:hypothetical protein
MADENGTETKLEPFRLKNLTKQYDKGKVTGTDLADMVVKGEITKGDRRRIQRDAKKLEVKKNKEIEKAEKKKAKGRTGLGLSREERRDKFLGRTSQNEYKESKSVCLGCRKRGHVLAKCQTWISERKQSLF